MNATTAPRERATFGLQPLVDLWNEVHLSWAMREIHPLHPDVPKIALDLARLRERNQRNTVAIVARALATAARAVGRRVKAAALAFWRWC